MPFDLYPRMTFGLMCLAAVFLASEAGAQVDTSSCPGMKPDVLTLRADRKIPLLKSPTAPRAILVNSTQDVANDDYELNVNSDGSPRAYHLLDPQGKNYALNDMYSGGVRVWENDTEIVFAGVADKDEHAALLRRYYDVFNRFVKEHDNFGVVESPYKPRNDPAYKLGDDFGNKLDPPPPSLLSSLTDRFSSFVGRLVQSEPTASFPERPVVAASTLSDYHCLPCTQTNCKVCFKKGIVKFSGADFCIRKSGRYAGFLVNETGLDSRAGNAPDPENAEDSTCDTPVNLDPEKLPGFVLPGGAINPEGEPGLVAAKGDVVIGYNPKSGMWAFGVVSDGGPPGKLGEASIGFNRILQHGYQAGASFPRPVSYRGDLLSSAYQPKRPINLLFLPGSLQRFKRPGNPADHPYDFSPQTVASNAKAAFLEWAATTDLNVARDKFHRCAALLPPQ